VTWACLQLGSREHYEVASALHGAGSLEMLVTDSWLGKHLAETIRPWAPSLANRRRDDIPDRLVRHRTIGSVWYSFRLRLSGVALWDALTRRNDWFGEWAAKQVSRSSAQCVFSYAYTARAPFRVAERRSAMRIHGQIDPGPRHFDIVAEMAAKYPNLCLGQQFPPDEYWRSWREEIQLASKIIVNSSWSSMLLCEAGVPAKKLVEIPLVYEPRSSVAYGAGGMVRKPNKRLQALFLGGVLLAKGVGQLFDAMRKLKSDLVDFTFAGPIGVRVPDDIRAMPQVRFLGPVDRATAERLYSESDVFLFPTLSDGFGLTQLEALGYGCPVISSMNCARVVDHRVNGLLLEDVTPELIAESLLELMSNRDLLAQLKSNAVVPDRFHPRHLAPALLALERN